MAIIWMETIAFTNGPPWPDPISQKSFSDPMCHLDPGGCVRLVAALKSDKMNLIPWRCLWVDLVGGSDFSEDPWRSLVCKLVSWKHFGRFRQSFKLMSFCNFRELKRSMWNLIGFPGSRLRFSAQIKQRQNKLSPNCVSNQIINQIWSFAETIWAKDSILL